MTLFRLRIMAQVLPFLLIAPGLASAQMPPTRGQATAALNQTNPANPAAARYTRQQIDQMVAPIALYPDQLLAQVLMAATYPQQVVEASQWVKDPGNAALKGDALVVALQPLPWDPSVKALAAFPQIVAMMSDHIEWTETLGVAFATQQAEVMARVQALRHLAFKSGRLSKLRHLAVRQEGPVILIAPAEADQLFVPVYNPLVVYGEWPDRDFPPVFIPPPPGFVLETIEPGFEIGAGYAIVAPLWGWSRPDWRANRIIVDRVGFTRITRNLAAPANNVWVHSGPVVLVVPTTRTGAASATVPAGTVAPAAAAAVVGLPQRAAAQPALIQSRTTTTQPSTAQPGQTQTTTTQPSTAQPGQAQTTTTQPSTAQPGPTRATTTQPSTTQPGQAQTTTSQPSTAKPGQAQTTTSQPSTAKPGQAQRETTHPAGTEGATSEPGKPQARTGHPGAGEPATAPRARSERGQTTPTQPGATLTTPTQPSERHPGQSQAVPRGTPGTAPAPSANQVREPAPPTQAVRPAERAMYPAPERAVTQPPREAREPMPRAPEHAGPPVAPQAPVGARSPAPAAQRPVPESVGQGTSGPPAAAPQSAPPQSMHRPPAEQHQPAGRSEEGKSKER